MAGVQLSAGSNLRPPAQGLALTRAESSPSEARKQRWTAADLRYSTCERLILPLIDADLTDPRIVTLLQSKTARYNASGEPPGCPGLVSCGCCRHSWALLP